MLKYYCRSSDGSEKDFVGLRFVDGHPQVTFPLGYRQSVDDKDVRHDILNLLSVLHVFSKRREGVDLDGHGAGEHLSFPVYSYQYIIYDFLSHGYYTEKDVEYKVGEGGKINWAKTIKRVKPVVNGGNFIYLDYVVKNSAVKSDIITRIHEYCVYECFSKLGWLFLESAFVPRRPSIKFNKKLFLTTLNDALKHTFNVQKKELFSRMTEIVQNANEQGECPDMYFGVNGFEFVWENLIDYVFGVDNKQEYFPHGQYHIMDDGCDVESSPLKPDTIMISDEKIFILDAKYYRFGIDNKAKRLPATESIHKQITYGDYVFENYSRDKHNLYNAFIIPYDGNDMATMRFVAVGTGDWVAYDDTTPDYKYIIVLCLDTKHIMKTFSRLSESSIEKMGAFIEESLERYKNETI